MFKFYKTVTVAALIIISACRIQAQQYIAGVRGGASFGKNPGNFQEADVFTGMYLPWLWGSQNGLNLKPRVEVSAGWLNNEGDSAFVGTLGPAVELREGKFPVTLDGGVSLSALSRSDFPERNLGGWFEFTDHIGLNWHVTESITLGLRYQHMSNAGFYRHNPGLNLLMLSFGYRF